MWLCETKQKTKQTQNKTKKTKTKKQTNKKLKKPSYQEAVRCFSILNMKTKHFYF